MTEHQNQGQGWQPPPQGTLYTPPPTQPVPPPKKKAPTWLVVTVAVLVGVCGIGTIAAIASSGTDQEPVPGQREAPAEPAEPAAEKPDPPDPVFPEPDPDDFELSIKTLSKECFGSAGCLIDFRVELAYAGPNLDPDVTYEITYEVTGGESDYINTLTATGDKYSTEETESISTASDVDLGIEITDVSEF